ncbi:MULTISPECIES: hypothetical protein [Streptomyces]|uniref:Uncharacterized protein n=1 Tax=Streptomyces griseus TaxID=1911 RepID=A0A380MRQ1_STRGR|nr:MULTISPECIES: hypothetical protein [Streptomyces]WPR52688.1 hypothetical protein SJI45_18215 [Streptomyces sp. S399]SUO94007.1 Uncharacterised protein [Streptomyces griseus]
MTNYGDPIDWDEIPDGWTDAFTVAIQAHGHTVLDAHESAITLDVPGLDEDERWAIVVPNFHGLWAYGTYRNGHCDNPTWLYADATDPQEIADLVHAVLTDAPLNRHWMAGAFSVWT